MLKCESCKKLAPKLYQVDGKWICAKDVPEWAWREYPGSKQRDLVDYQNGMKKKGLKG